jgi:hypothetical protein
MGLYQLMIQKNLYRFARAPYPDFVSDMACRQGIEGVLKDDMVIGVYSAFFPDGDIKRLTWQRL